MDGSREEVIRSDTKPHHPVNSNGRQNWQCCGGIGKESLDVTLKEESSEGYLIYGNECEYM
jgi:hypothetical protein